MSQFTLPMREIALPMPGIGVAMAGIAFLMPEIAIQMPGIALPMPGITLPIAEITLPMTEIALRMAGIAASMAEIALPMAEIALLMAEISVLMTECVPVVERPRQPLIRLLKIVLIGSKRLRSSARLFMGFQSLLRFTRIPMIPRSGEEKNKRGPWRLVRMKGIPGIRSPRISPRAQMTRSTRCAGNQGTLIQWRTRGFHPRWTSGRLSPWARNSGIPCC
eukprot:gene14645-biopygen21660